MPSRFASRGVDVPGLVGDDVALFGRQVAGFAQILQAVGGAIQNNANVPLDDGEHGAAHQLQRLAVGFRVTVALVLRFAGVIVQVVQPFDEGSGFFAKLFAYGFSGLAGVRQQAVVEQAGDEGGGVHSQLVHRLGNGQIVLDEQLTGGLSLTAIMDIVGKLVRLSHLAKDRPLGRLLSRSVMEMRDIWVIVVHAKRRLHRETPDCNLPGSPW